MHPTKKTIKLGGREIEVNFTISAIRRLRAEYPDMDFTGIAPEDLVINLIHAGQKQEGAVSKEWLLDALDDFSTYEPSEVYGVIKAFEAASGSFQALLSGQNG